MKYIALLFVLLSLLGFRIDSGALSFYRPGDGWNVGRLACGGEFTFEQNHIAYREWPVVGCNRKVFVCAFTTFRCEWSKVRDAGPFGIVPIDGSKGWRIWTKRYTAPPGWRFRGIVDLSDRLWRRLGKPPFLSFVVLIFPPKQ